MAEFHIRQKGYEEQIEKLKREVERKEKDLVEIRAFAYVRENE